jgi:hypothetical protein
MTRSFLATCVAITAIASTLTVADRAAGLNFTKVIMNYKPQDDKDRIIILDPSTIPPTPVQNVDLILQDAGIGTPQNPLGPLPLATTLGIVTPDPAGLGDAARKVITNVGIRHDDEAPQESFVVVRTQISDPDTGQPTFMKKGTVKFFNESKGFGFVVSGQAPGQPEFDYSLVGQIDPAQLGLTFTAAPDVQGGGPTGDSFFDIFTQLHFDGTVPINPDVPLFSLTLTQVPEPSTCILAAIALAALPAMLRNRKR